MILGLKPQVDFLFEQLCHEIFLCPFKVLSELVIPTIMI